MSDFIEWRECMYDPDNNVWVKQYATHFHYFGSKVRQHDDLPADVLIIIDREEIGGGRVVANRSWPEWLSNADIAARVNSLVKRHSTSYSKEELQRLKGVLSEVAPPSPSFNANGMK